MTAMEQEIVPPETIPRTTSQAFSPLGCMLAASGMTLLVLTKLGAAMAVSVWAFSKLLGLPEWLMFALMALGIIPVIWATVWTAGRAWHVERRLAAHLDIDTPVFTVGHYFRKS